MSTFAFVLNIPNPLLLAVIIALLVCAYVILTYNRIVRDRNLLAEAESGIDVQLTRRSDLVPNLVETVSAYSAHERHVLTDLTRLRAESAAAPRLAARASAENALTQALRGLFAVAERYPHLKADKTFLSLQSQLVDIEDTLQMSRRYYNGAVREYNIRVESFPSNIVAAILSFRREEFFELDTATARNAPHISITAKDPAP